MYFGKVLRDAKPSTRTGRAGALAVFLGELPADFASDVRAWLLVLLDGDSRANPRSHTCLYVYFG